MTDPNTTDPKATPPTTTLWGVPTTLTPSYWAAIRQFLTLMAGVAGTLGLISMTGAQHLVDTIMQVGTALSAVMTAIAGLVAAVNMVLAAYRASEGQAKARVSQLPNTMVVQTTPDSSDTASAAKIAMLPEVAQVISTPQVAANTTSHKVVSPDSPGLIETVTGKVKT